jgi:hypothetical protein
MIEGKQGKFHVVMFENMGGIDYNFFDLTISNVTSSNSNVENMATSNVAIVEVVHLVVIKVKIALWKLHHHSSIY